MSDLKPAPNGYPIKLVRDGTAAVINDSGRPGDLFYGPLTQDQSKMKWLRKKLAEELGEYLIDGDFKELLDILDVIEALVVEHGRSLDYALAVMKGHPRGGFHNGVMMYGRHPEFDNRAKQ